MEDTRKKLLDGLMKLYELGTKVLITKKCGYEKLYLFGEYADCGDLIKQVSAEFKHRKPNGVNKYWVEGENGKVELPTNGTPLRSFLNWNSKPVYELPLPVVYRVFFDDGSDHSH